VPKTLIQHLIRWVVSSKQFEAEVGEVLESVLDTEITPELVPTARTNRCRAARPKSVRRRCRTSPSSTSCATGSGPRRSLSWPGTPGTIRNVGGGPRAFPPINGSATSSRRSGTGFRCSCGDSSRSTSSSARLCPTAPRYPRAGRCLPEVTGAHPRTWRRRSGCGGGNGSAAVGVERYARRHQPEGMTPTGRVSPRYG
jgi:NAD+ synthase (glutamine-hydrolysing)